MSPISPRSEMIFLRIGMGDLESGVELRSLMDSQAGNLRHDDRS